jgi:short-subunit dehydrogenase
LLLENRGKNVLTTALCPGFTYSEFHDVTGTRSQVSKMGKAWWSSAEEVAAAGYDGVMRGRSIVITGRRSKQVAALMKVLPEPIALGIVARRSKSYRAD